MIDFMGVEYSRGATANIRNGGPALAPGAIRKMFPDTDWTIIAADNITPETCAQDRFGDAFQVQQKIYKATPDTRHILIGGDHSVNFGHFAALADRNPHKDLCLVYIDAHLDIHTPETSIAQASGAPHGTNVRALLGDGDKRWLGLQTKRPALQSKNLFYLGTRSYEEHEISYAKSQNIYIRTAAELQTPDTWAAAVDEIKKRIGSRPYVVSFDFDSIDPHLFPDVWVPEPNGLGLDAVRYFLHKFSDADSFEFVEYAPSGNTESAQVACDLINIIAHD